MLGSLAFAGVAAIAVFVTTAIVVLLTRKENAETKEAFEKYKLETERQISDANERTEKERLARVKIEARIAPRTMTQSQQYELAAALSVFKGEKGTIIASPSTPESEMFARWLGAPLKEAGWEMEILPGTATATVIFPTGIIVEYQVDPSIPDTSPENVEHAKPASILAGKLMEFGIEATAVPGFPPALQPKNTIEIIVSVK